MKSTAEVPACPITRARAATYLQSGAMPSRELSKLQDHKLTMKHKPKRAAGDEMNENAPFLACNQPKRRAMLKDITNVFCDNHYRNCLKASKIQSKKKEDREGSFIPSNSAPVVAGALKLPVDSATEVGEEIQHTLPHPAKIVSLKKVDKNPPIKSLKGVVKDHCKDSNLSAQDCGDLLQCPSIPVKAENNLQYDKSGVSATLDFTDIDADHSDTLLCSLYASDIYRNFHVAEVNRRPNSIYMESVQQDITQSMRGILVDWLVEVCEEYKLVPDTLYLTVYLIDKFLSRNCISRQRLQLLSITCLLIASKFEELCAPRVEELCFITDYTYTKLEVLELESHVLNNLGFHLSVPTAKTFLRRFLRAAQSSYEDSSLELEFLAKYLTELTLVHYSFLKYLPSSIAASAVFLARWTLKQAGHPWNSTLEYYTRYKASDLRTSVVALQALQLNDNACPSHAIRAKYNQDKYKCVAALHSPELDKALFQR